MPEISFLLNGEHVELTDVSPTKTVLDWLREEKGLTGTKEGCNEGDCGACTVMVTDEYGARPLNACILFLPQLHKKALRTVEGLAGPDGQLHPVQQAMVDHHGSQCGFCTPGFVMSMAVSHVKGATDHKDRLAGNLCRCTGYKPIVNAAQAVQDSPIPDQVVEDLSGLTAEAAQGSNWIAPVDIDDFAEWYVDHPDATLIAGATDVGLWVTKNLAEFDSVAFLAGLDQLRTLNETESHIQLGALMSIAQMREAISPLHPSFAELLRRFGSEQVRCAATLGGNIANGSPIGDGAPALIALDADLILRKGKHRRTIKLEDFFLEYGKQDRQPGEFVESLTIEKQPDRLKCYKLSKRFDQDISAVCGCFNIRPNGDVVSSARIAFGGMAGTPKRARHVEQTITGQPWTVETVGSAWDAWEKDFTPLSDMRATAKYRMDAARNMLTRYFAEDMGVGADVLQVKA